jgi:hypothetical protein
MATVAPYAKLQFFDDNGAPLAGGKVYYYDAGTSDAKDTYSDQAGTIANANPVILDSAGRATIFLGSGSYKQVVKTSADVLVSTVDGIAGTDQYSTVDTVAELKALRSGQSDTVIVHGYYAAGDGGGGMFYWNSSSTATADNGVIVQPNSAPSTGRWFRMVDGYISPKFYGAKGDGTTNDTAAIQAADTFANANGYVLSFRDGTYVINNTTIASDWEFYPDAMISVNSGQAVTFSGKAANDPLWQIFTGSGTVTFGAGAVRYVRPEWCGGCGTANDYAPVLAAVEILGRSGGGTLAFLDNKTYTWNTSIPLDDDIKVEAGKNTILRHTTNTTTGLWYTQNKENIEITGGIYKGLNIEQEANPVVERLIFFVGCDDVKVHDIEICETHYAVQFQQCTNWEFVNNYVHDIKHGVDDRGGYGVLANTDNIGFEISGNRFKQIGRHSVYTSEGSRNFVVSGNTSKICRYSHYSTNSDAAAGGNPVDNGTIIGNTFEDSDAADPDTSPGATRARGIDIYWQCKNLTITGNTLKNIDAYPISLEGDDADEIQNKPTGIAIVGNIIDGGGDKTGLRVANSEDVTIGHNIVKNRSTGIMVTTSGSGLSSYTRDVIVDNNIVDTMSNRGINVGGEVENIKIGANNILKNVAVRNYEIAPNDLDEVKYAFNRIIQTYTYDFVPNNALGTPDYPALQLNISDDGARTIVCPKEMRVLSMSARLNGTPGAGSLTLSVLENGSSQAGLSVVLNGANPFAKTVVSPEAIIIQEGNTVGVQCISSSDFANNCQYSVAATIELVEV